MKKLKPILFLLISLILIGLIGWITFGEFPGLTARSARNIHLGLDLAGGVSITYQAADNVIPSEEEMKGSLSVIQRRLDTKGYTEASAYIDGNNRIRVEIPMGPMAQRICGNPVKSAVSLKSLVTSEQ